MTQAPDQEVRTGRRAGWPTVNHDGSPHVTGVGALWFDGTFWFETGTGTKKGRNLARYARCTLSLATHGFDLVVEGRAEPVTDPATVATILAERWRAGSGWPGLLLRACPHRRVQRSVGRATSVDGLPDGGGDGDGRGRYWRQPGGDPLALRRLNETPAIAAVPTEPTVGPARVWWVASHR